MIASKLQNIILLITLLIVTFLFSKSVLMNEHQVYYSLIYCLFIICFFILQLHLHSKHGLLKCILTVLSIHLTVLATFYFYDGNTSLLWQTDAIEQHLPISLRVVNLLEGTEDFEILNLINFKNKIYISSLWIGTFFFLFGVNPIVSSVALLIIKIFTISSIFHATKRIYGNKQAFIAALIYTTMPTITFYTLQFYKEAFIHFFISLFLLGLTIKSSKIKYPLIFFTITMLVVERFYLGPILCFGFIVYELVSYKVSKKIMAKVILLGLILCILVGKAYFNTFDLRHIYKNFWTLKLTYAGNDTSMTPNLGFPIDFIRILFTPWFTSAKLITMRGFDSLLTWGSFLNQGIILIYLISLFKERNNKFTLINVSFLLLLILFSILAPYSGRIRDSFYPFVVLFASTVIAKLNSPFLKLGSTQPEK